MRLAASYSPGALVEEATSMSIYHSTNPFIYVIGWSDINAWYLGAKWAKGCDPVDLWTTYFTSSKVVALLRDEWGEPDIFEAAPVTSDRTARDVEADLIERFSLHTSDRWLNRCSIISSLPTSVKGKKPREVTLVDNTLALQRMQDYYQNRTHVEGRFDMLSDILTSQEGHRAISKRYGLTGERVRQIRVKFGWEKQQAFSTKHRYCWNNQMMTQGQLMDLFGKPRHWVRAHTVDGVFNPHRPKPDQRVGARNDAQMVRRREHYSTHSKKFDYEGGQYTLRELSEINGIKFVTLKSRIDRGWPVSRALKPVTRTTKTGDAKKT